MPQSLRSLVLGSLLLAIPAGLVLAGCQSASQVAPPMTKIEARSWPPDRVERRTAEQLGDILVLQQYPKLGGRPVNVLDRLWFDIGPRASQAQDVCEKQVVIVEFNREADLKPNSETLTRANWLSTETQYLVLDRPGRDGATTNPDYDWKQLAEACRKLSPSDKGFFKASDPQTALQAITWLKRIADGARSGQPDFTIKCDDPASCLKWLAERGVSAIWHAETCTRTDADCLVVTTYGQKFEIVDPARDNSPGSTVIDMHDLVIVADARID